MRASEAIVVLTRSGITLDLSATEIHERLTGGMHSEEVTDFGYELEGTERVWKIVRTRHQKDEAAERAARELK